jgi:CspA family cold shock protein
VGIAIHQIDGSLFLRLFLFAIFREEGMFIGKVEWFDQKKGYGFIAGSDGKNVFVHYSNVLVDGYKVLEAGQSVSYDVEQTEKGPKAINVVIQ